MEGGFFLWEMDVITIYQHAIETIIAYVVVDFYSSF